MEKNEEPFSQGLPINVGKIFSIFSRIMGIVVLLVGLWTALKVVDQVWELFEDQKLIVSFAAKIERESNVDKAFAEMLHIFDRIPQQLANVQPGGQAQPQPQPQPLKPKSQAKISYFIAWALTIILLFLIAKIGFWAITAGGQLAIYNADVENVAKAIVKEVLSRQAHV